MKRLSILTLALGACSFSFGTNLTLTGVADDFFVAYVSTTQGVEGTQFLQQVNTWPGGTVSASVTLTPGMVNYINIKAWDVFGAPSMFISMLSLSDTGFQFNDASQSIVSNDDSNWTASLVNYGQNEVSITDINPNGASPWGNFGTLPASARLIWTPGSVPANRYFQVAVTPVPEPASVIALVVGATALLRKRKN